MDYVAWPEYGKPERFDNEREAREFLEECERETGCGGWIYKYIATVDPT